jgi:hypothetical protein
MKKNNIITTALLFLFLAGTVSVQSMEQCVFSEANKLKMTQLHQAIVNSAFGDLITTISLLSDKVPNINYYNSFIDILNLDSTNLAEQDFYTLLLYLKRSIVVVNNLRTAMQQSVHKGRGKILFSDPMKQGVLDQKFIDLANTLHQLYNIIYHSCGHQLNNQQIQNLNAVK